MEQSGRRVASKSAKPSGGRGKDSISALPDELLLNILVRLDNTAEAARTSVLARRWQTLWRDLPEVCFHFAPNDGHRIRDLLDTDEPHATALRSIFVTTVDAAPDSAAAWLHAAARRLVGGRLIYHNVPPPENEDGEEEEAGGGIGPVQLPCFEKATKIDLDLWFLGLALPSQGEFSRLTVLSLTHVRFHSPCNLSDAVSWPRCPCLQSLMVDCRGLQELSINSKSLLQTTLRRVGRSFQHLKIVSPTLKELVVEYNFLGNKQSEQSATISAPELEYLTWGDVYDPQSFHLVGKFEQLQCLRTLFFWVYGIQIHRELNQYSLRLFERFKVLHTLDLLLINHPVGEDYQYLLGDVTVLPQVMFLHLNLFNGRHAFGAILFHLLRMCSGLRELFLAFCTTSKFEEVSACQSSCICDQPTGWKTDELVLNHLEDVRLIKLRGAEHEVAFVQRLLNWAPVLKNMRLTFDGQVSEDKIRVFRDALAGLSRPETCVEFDMDANR